MDDVRAALNTNGIVFAEGLYEASDIVAINEALDPIFAAKRESKRSYATVDELITCNIIDHVLNDAIVSSFYEIIDKPKMYQFHVFEIAGRNNSPHIAGANLKGWHRDHDSAYDPVAPSHISLFVYLTNVGGDDGSFEFMPHSGRGGFTNNADAIAVQGGKGTAFYWNRHFFHRASPNRGATRRRVLKFSIQSPESPALTTSLAAASRYMANKDCARQELFGHSGGSDTDLKPKTIKYDVPSTNMRVKLDPATLLKARFKEAIGLLNNQTKQLDPYE